MDMPTEDQTARLIDGLDSVHLRVCLGYVLKDGNMVQKDLVGGGEQIVTVLDLLVERGAQRGQDYIITLNASSGYLFCTLHTTDSFFSDEDIIRE